MLLDQIHCTGGMHSTCAASCLPRHMYRCYPLRAPPLTAQATSFHYAIARRRVGHWPNVILCTQWYAGFHLADVKDALLHIKFPLKCPTQTAIENVVPECLSTIAASRVILRETHLLAEVTDTLSSAAHSWTACWAVLHSMCPAQESDSPVAKGARNPPMREHALHSARPKARTMVGYTCSSDTPWPHH